MSSAACKVVIDWYAALGAEAWGFTSAAKSEKYDSLAAEGEALAYAAQAICEAGSEMVVYLEAEGGAEADVRKIVDLSTEACDWAQDMRRWTDRIFSGGERLSDEVIARWIAEMRAWRDAGTTLIRTLAEGQMGYPAESASDG